MKKIFILLLVLITLPSMTACQKEDNSATNTSGSSSDVSDSDVTPTTTTETVDPYGPVSESITIHIGRSENTSATYLEGEDSSNNYLINYIEEKLDVDYVYDFSVPADTYSTKVNMAISSGDIPDVMTVDESQMRQLVAAGVLEDMTDAFNTYASDNLKAAYESTNGISFGSATFDSKLMAMPSISPGADGVPLLFIRGDWMEELNIDPPESLDDIINIVNTFKEEKELKNGLIVSSNIVSKGGNNTYGIDALFALFDAYPKHFVTDSDGNIVYGSNTPEAKTALQEISKLVNDGIIDSSFVVRDSDTCAELVTSEQAGVFFGAWWNMSWPLNNMVQEDPTIYWNCYLAPLTDEGKYNTAMISPSNAYLVVKSGASEALKEAVIKTMNYQFDIDQDQGSNIKQDPSDPYSWTAMPFSLLLSRYDDKEGKALAAISVINGEKEESELSGETLLWYNSYKAAEEDITTATTLSGWAYIRAAGTLGQNDNIMNKVFDASYSKTETMDSKWATLEKLEDEIYLKILNGEADIDTFDDYVEQWYSLGGSDIIKELEAIQ